MKQYVDFEKKFKKAMVDSFRFLLGFLPLVVGLWILVIIQPGGLEQFVKTYRLYTSGGVYLSGQALNLNWIVTYFTHIFVPGFDYPLSVLGGLNRQIAPIPDKFHAFPPFL